MSDNDLITLGDLADPKKVTIPLISEYLLQEFRCFQCQPDLCYWGLPCTIQVLLHDRYGDNPAFTIFHTPSLQLHIPELENIEFDISPEALVRVLANPYRFLLMDDALQVMERKIGVEARRVTDVFGAWVIHVNDAVSLFYDTFGAYERFNKEANFFTLHRERRKVFSCGTAERALWYMKTKYGVSLPIK